MKLKVAVNERLLADVSGDDGAFGVTDSELVFVGASGVQRCQLGQVTRVSRDGADIVISGDSGTLLRAPITADKDALVAFFGVVQKTAGQARAAQSAPPAPAPVSSPPAPTVPMPSPTSDAALIGRDVPPPARTQPMPSSPSRMSNVSPNENRMAPLEYGSFGLRLLAAIIDSVIVSIITTVVSIPFGLGAVLDLARLAELVDPNTGELTGGSDADVIAAASRLIGAYIMFVLLSGLVQWLYFALLESSARQGTLGKQWLGLKVTDMNGDRIGFGRATGRFFSKFISGIILMIGYLMALFSEKKQALHDSIAGTLVLQTNKDG